jgi:ribosomal silencing factor RsfS
MSDLRDRIAAVIASGRMDRSNYELADAVIRELQLQRESPQLCVGGGDRHRWVTEWVSGG